MTLQRTWIGPTGHIGNIGIFLADTPKTKKGVLAIEKGRAIGIITRHDVIEKS